MYVIRWCVYDESTVTWWGIAWSVQVCAGVVQMLNGLWQSTEKDHSINRASADQLISDASRFAFSQPNPLCVVVFLSDELSGITLTGKTNPRRKTQVCHFELASVTGLPRTRDVPRPRHVYPEQRSDEQLQGKTNKLISQCELWPVDIEWLCN